MSRAVNTGAEKTEIAERPTLQRKVDPTAHSAGHTSGRDLVTVIVPCYNGAAYLGEALSSVLAQTHAAVEIIVVDDGSTDNSPEVAQSFPVRYIRQTNRGLPGARNTGIHESNGDYIVFLDADDRLLPHAIASGLQALTDHPDCAIAVGDHAFISMDGARLRRSAKKEASPSAYEALLRSNFIEMISSVLFRRSVFEQVGPFNPALRVAEDYDLYLRIARVQPICCYPTIVAEYRMHTASISHNSELMLLTTLQVLKNQKPFVIGDEARELAYRAGIQSWSKQYGRRLARELACAGSISGVKNLGHKMRSLALYYPQGLLMFVALSIEPSLLHRQSKSPGRPSETSGDVYSLRRAFQELVHRR